MYLSGFGNYHRTEAIDGALPPDQNSPQPGTHGLYAEQLSGTAFTRPRHLNLHSWLYRTLPSVVQSDYNPYPHLITRAFASKQPPNPMRWSPSPIPTSPQDFVDGLVHLAGNTQLHAYRYACNQSMNERYLSNYDGELLLVPYDGGIELHTELGVLAIQPGLIAVIPRGIKFKVQLSDAFAAGYVCENAGQPLTLPQLGPIGANGLANPRHFMYPKAHVEEPHTAVTLICKYQQRWWQASSPYSPLNVVAWHGNYAPYCYDLSLFNAINTVSFDHPDPSIFTVLTSESAIPGIANLDFVIFPPRWMVAEHTFRPPYFHRNRMSELMGLVQGEYDAKKEGFHIGGVSIHNGMTPHGPDSKTFQNAATQPLKPHYYENTLAFMFESCEPWLVTNNALTHPTRQKNYTNCWSGFNPRGC